MSLCEHCRSDRYPMVDLFDQTAETKASSEIVCFVSFAQCLARWFESKRKRNQS
jgi:hypothetical protein